MLVEWKSIDYVLLDMDGTILDKYFDDYFWEEFVPKEYAKKNNLPFNVAKKKLLERYKLEEGKLTWTDIDFWSDKLGLDIAELKNKVSYLIRIQPNVKEFLNFLKKLKKNIYLVTNAHYKTLEIKLRKTSLEKYFDKILSAFDINRPKTDNDFWLNAQKLMEFDRKRTLLIDDDEEALRVARDYGIRYLLLKSLANSKKNPKSSEEFPSIIDFQELVDYPLL
jgi:putative hydrolase of the HAD superfamily